MRLGRLIEELEKWRSDLEIKIRLWQDGSLFHPDKFGSYRGYYDQLALEYSSSTASTTVGSLLAQAMAADGETFEGYKGGDFTMSLQTTVWVAQYGSSSSTGISRLLMERAGLVIIDTIDVSDYQGW